MSDTPRTDAKIRNMDDRHFLLSSCSRELVGLARHFERELASMTQRAEMFESACAKALDERDAAIKERDGWRKEVDRWKDAYNRSAQQNQAELAKVCRDWLAERQQQHRTGASTMTTDNTTTQALDHGKFDLVRDANGFAQAIAVGEWFVAHLERGTVRNEQNAARIVAILNAAVAVVHNEAGVPALRMALEAIMPNNEAKGGGA